MTVPAAEVRLTVWRLLETAAAVPDADGPYLDDVHAALGLPTGPAAPALVRRIFFDILGERTQETPVEVLLRIGITRGEVSRSSPQAIDRAHRAALRALPPGNDIPARHAVQASAARAELAH